MRFPDLLIPLIAKGVVTDEGILRFWHDTMLLIFPPGARVNLTYRPRQGYVYIVFGITFGKPRDYETGDVLTTDDYGFWHRHGQMRWHWDPSVESIYMTDYPHWLEVTTDDPVELFFYNDTDRTILQDVSIWLFECTKRSWRVVTRYLKGIYRTFYERGGRE